MAPAPARVTRLLGAARHPVRLPLLIELERLGESSASELSEVLDAPFDKVDYALRKLAADGAVEFVRREHRPGANTSRNVYRPYGTGWADLMRHLERTADQLLAADPDVAAAPRPRDERG